MHPIYKEFAFLSFCLSLGFLSNALTCYLSFGLQLEYFESCFANIQQNSCFDYFTFFVHADQACEQTRFVFKHASLSWKLLNMSCLISFFRPSLLLNDYVWLIRTYFYVVLICNLTFCCIAFLSPACFRVGKAKLQLRGVLISLCACILNGFSLPVFRCLAELRFETTDSELFTGFSKAL